MKLYKRVVEDRLKREVTVGKQYYGSMLKKSTVDAMFSMRVLMGRHREGRKEIRCVFVDLEKVYDRVSREELCVCEGGAGDEDSRDSGEVCGKSER